MAKFDQQQFEQQNHVSQQAPPINQKYSVPAQYSHEHSYIILYAIGVAVVLAVIILLAKRVGRV